MAQILRTEKLKIVRPVAGSNLELIKDMTFFINEKEWTNIIIPHGYGKTSLFYVLTGRDKPAKGKIIFNNKEKLDTYDTEKFIKENITFVPEYPSAVSDFTVKDWTRFQMQILGIKKDKSLLEKYFELLEDQGIETEKRMNQLTLVEIRIIECGFSIVANTILIVCDDIEVNLQKEEMNKLGTFLKVLSASRAIVTLSSDAVWNKFAKNIVRTV